MNMKQKLSIALLAVSAVLFSNAQTSKAAKEYLHVPGPISLNNISYSLTWTSHPSANYYKQEYIPAGDKVDRYKKMISVELLISNATAADLANAKMNELKQLKATNPLINYGIYQKNGEIILDFLISQNTANGKEVEIIERNVYRYKNFSGKNGEKGVILFGASERAYGKDVDSFLVLLKKDKPVLLNAVAVFNLPPISVKE